MLYLHRHHRNWHWHIPKSEVNKHINKRKHACICTHTHTLPSFDTIHLFYFKCLKIQNAKNFVLFFFLVEEQVLPPNMCVYIRCDYGDTSTFFIYIYFFSIDLSSHAQFISIDHRKLNWNCFFFSFFSPTRFYGIVYIVHIHKHLVLSQFQCKSHTLHSQQVDFQIDYTIEWKMEIR